MNKIYFILLLVLLSGSARAVPINEPEDASFQDSTMALVNELNGYIPLPDTSFTRSVKLLTDSLASRLAGQMRSLAKQKLKFYGTAGNTAGIQQRTGASQGMTALNHATVEGGVHVFNLPLGFEYANVSSRIADKRYTDNLFRINFDKERFLKTPVNPLQQIGELKSRIQLPDITNQIKTLIASQLSKVNSLYDPREISRFKALTDYIADPANAFELLELNEADLRAKLQGNVKKHVVSGSTLAAKAAGKDIVKWKGKLDSIVTRVNHVKLQLARIGCTVQKIRAMEKLLAADPRVSMSDVAEITGLSGSKDDYLQLLLSKLRTLKMGAFGNNIFSPTLSRDILMKGAHVSVLTGRGPVTLGYGRNEDLEFVKDPGMESSVYASPQKLAYLSVGINNSDILKGKFTWINSVSSGQLNERFNVSSLPRNSVGLTVSQRLALAKLGTLNVDLSKSASVYRNAFEPGTERVLEHRNLFNDYLFDSSLQTLAVGISHQGEIAPWNISNNFYMNYSGLGYQNPLVTGISPVRFKVGGVLKKKFFNNKVFLNLRTDFRNTPVNSISDDHWKNHNVQIEGRVRVNRKFSVSMRYSENGMVKEIDNVNNTIYSSDKFQMNATGSYKIGRFHTSSHLSIAYQNLNNTQVQTGDANFLNMNYAHSALMGQNSLTAMVFYNKEMSPYQLIGDMLNSEICYQYILGDKLNLSTALNFFENTKISKQYGIRQSVQLLASKSVDLNASADIRRNLIEPVYPDLYPACRAELSFKYFLNK